MTGLEKMKEVYNGYPHKLSFDDCLNLCIKQLCPGSYGIGSSYGDATCNKGIGCTEGCWKKALESEVSK